MDQAIIDYSRVIELFPDDWDALNDRAWARYRKEDYDQAILDATQAIEVETRNPRDHWYSYHTRGAAYAAKGDHDSAIADFQQALTLEPDDSEYEQEMRSYLLQHDIQ